MAYFNNLDVVVTQDSGHDNTSQQLTLLVTDLPGYASNSNLVIRRASVTKLAGTSGTPTQFNLLFQAKGQFYRTIPDFGTTTFFSPLINYTKPVLYTWGSFSFLTTQPSSESVTLSLEYQFIPINNPVFTAFNSQFFSGLGGTNTLIYTNSTSNSQYIQSLNLSGSSWTDGATILLTRKSTTSIITAVFETTALNRTTVEECPTFLLEAGDELYFSGSSGGLVGANINIINILNAS